MIEPIEIEDRAAAHQAALRLQASVDRLGRTNQPRRIRIVRPRVQPQPYFAVGTALAFAGALQGDR